MKRIIVLSIILMVSVHGYAGEFRPTLLKLTADPLVNYDYDGSELEIPVNVTGTPARLIFCLFTKDAANIIPATQNGFLGWHFVNKVDTCIYHSEPYQFDTGDHVVTWDGKDQDGAPVPAGEYTYYLWAYDNVSGKEIVCRQVSTYSTPWMRSANVAEVDENGLPLTNPFWYSADERWTIGHDPDESQGMIKTEIELEDGWIKDGIPSLDRGNLDAFFISVVNDDLDRLSIQKLKYIPGGRAEIYDWGPSAPYADYTETFSRHLPGVLTDGDYLYTVDCAETSSVIEDSNLFIYYMDGNLVRDVYLTPWWSNPDDLAMGGQMNGGPESFCIRHGMIAVNSHRSCIVQMMDPLRYLETGEYDDLFVWSNGNGDYMLDRNFEETAQLPWICNDSNVGPDGMGIYIDINLFTLTRTNENGRMSFGLLAPDGTGLGYHRYAEEGMGPKYGMFIIDADTPYDGIYTDNFDSYQVNIDYTPAWYAEHDGFWFIANDSIKGSIGSFDFEYPQSIMDLVSPNGGETIEQGKQYKISWNFTGMRDRELFLKISFSADDGKSWEVIKNTIYGPTGSFTWNVPLIESDRCLIRLSEYTRGLWSETSDDVFSVVPGDVGIVETKPYESVLSQNMPNPFNPITVIPFTLAERSFVTLTVYNSAGEKVTSLAQDRFSAGSHSVVWDASDYASGMYFCTMKTGEYSETRKMLLVR